MDVGKIRGFMSMRREFKVGLFIVFTTIVILLSLLYLAYAKGYFEKFANKTYYAHIKTCDSKDHKVTDVIQDNELDLGVIFDILAKAKINYLAIEIPQQAKFEDVEKNLLKSVDYLKSKF